MPKVAQTTFELKAQQEVLVADVYNEVPESAPFSAASPTLNGALNSVIDGIKGLVDTEGEVRQLTLDVISGKFKDSTALKKRLTDATGGVFSDINAIKNNVMDQALSKIGFNDLGKNLIKGLAGVPGSPDPLNTFLELNPRLKIIHDGVEYVRNSDDYKIDDFQTAFKVLGNITGNPEIAKVVDLEAKFSAVNSLIGIATQLKVPFLLDELKNVLSEDEYTEASRNSLIQVAKNSDLISVNKIVDEIKPGMTLATKPDLIEYLLANFRVIDPSKGIGLEHANELVQTLDRIKPDWDKIKRRGVLVKNVGIYAGCSEDAFTALKLLPDHGFAVQIARLYAKQSNIQSLRNSFPRAIR